MSGEGPSALRPPTGGNGALVASGSPLVARGLADLTPATRRVLVVAPDEASQADACAVVARHECVPVGHAHPGNPSDLLAYLPFEVAILMGQSVEFLGETRLLLPDEIPIVCEMTGEEGKSKSLEAYDRAFAAGAAFVQWPGGRMLMDTNVLPDALVLARFLRDHPDARGWPAPAPPVPGAFRILYVQDDECARAVVPHMLERAGYEDVRTASDGVEGLEQFREQSFDVLWTNESMPRMDGSEILARLGPETQGRIPCVIDSGYGADWPGRAKLAFRCLPLPFDIRQVIRLVHDAVRLRRAFQYALSPRVLCGARGASALPLTPPPAPPS